MKSKMTARRIGTLLVLLCGAISAWWAFALVHSTPGVMVDFRAVYYASRCLLEHADPYQPAELLRVYLPAAGPQPSDPLVAHLLLRGVAYCINLPTTMLVVAPLAMLGWAGAHVLWLMVTAVALTVGALLQWRLAAERAANISLFLVCLWLANTEILLALGNAAGLVISLCAIAAWCFWKERFAAAGVLCLALGLAIKPQDAGPVWLCFLLLGASYRKRALQTLAVAAVLAVPAMAWMGQVAPHWPTELRANVAATSGPGDINNPGPASLARQNGEPIIDLQSAISLLRDDARIYNPVTYILCAPLLLVWALALLKARPSPQNAWIGLAAIVALSLVVTYHRLYDAKLLLLTIPACALVWAEGGLSGQFALLLNTMGIVLTGEVPVMFLREFTEKLPVAEGGLFRRSIEILAVRPVPIVLLALGIFYLWMFLRRTVPFLAVPKGKAMKIDAANRLEAALERESEHV